MIHRTYEQALASRLWNDNRITIIYGPRQVGKTTLVRTIIKKTFEKKILEINADDIDYTDILSSRSLKKIRHLTAGYDILFIDEAQRVPDIGINLKIIYDSIPELKVIATGSSSFDLANKIQEPLTGRAWTYLLLPISVSELSATYNRFEIDKILEDFMVFGFYPALFNIENRQMKINYLREITRSYLFKDVLAIGSLKYPPKIRDLVRLLAHQIGSEVSLSELSNKLQIAKETVASYIDLLEKTFVVFRISGFSRNLRKEVTRHDKIYFYDLGVRNAAIENFAPIESRADKGQLWENFLIVERMKTQTFNMLNANRYFWRTYTGAELDYVEEREGTIAGYEFKYNHKVKSAPASWLETYNNATFLSINKDNYLDFVLEV